MSERVGRLILVTGAAGSGTTTVGAALAAGLPRAVHVDGDAVAGFVVSGAVPTRPPLTRDALEQLYLRWSAAIAVAETYAQAGFDAVISDTVTGELFADFVDFVSPAPLHVVTLGPDLDAPAVGLRLDTSGMSAEVAAAEIAARLDEALIDTEAPL